MSFKKSRQQLLDEEYCKFGYTYNRTTGDCDIVAVPRESTSKPETPTTPPVEEAAPPSKGKAVALKDAYVKGVADAMKTS